MDGVAGVAGFMVIVGWIAAMLDNDDVDEELIGIVALDSNC